MAELAVELHSAKPHYAYGESLHLAVEVKNLTPLELYLVRDRVCAVPTARNALEVLHAQVELPDGMSYFAFHAPRLSGIAPRGMVKLAVHLAMPLRRGFIGLDGMYDERTMPVEGEVTISLLVGYTGRRFHALTDGPWGELALAQRLTPPATTVVFIEGP
jgi:hypothetical protein